MLVSRLQDMLGSRERPLYLAARALYRGGRKVGRRPTSAARQLLRLHQTVDVRGLQLVIPDDMRWAYRDGKYYEQGMSDRLYKLADGQPRTIFYDIGANCGYYTLLLAPVSDAVHSFEPVATTFGILQGNVVANDLHHVTLHRVALVDTNRSDTVRLYSSSGNNSLFDVTEGPIHRTGEQVVDVRTIDELVFEAGIVPPTLMKIDIEGGELGCLRGARRTLAQFRPTVVCEFFGPHFEAAGYSAADLVAELRKHGYDLFTFDSDSGSEPTALTDASTADGRATLLGIPAP